MGQIVGGRDGHQWGEPGGQPQEQPDRRAHGYGGRAGANAIGNLSTGDDALLGFTNKIAHAVAVYAMGAAKANGGCGAGRMGAVIREIAEEAYVAKADTVQFATIAAAVGMDTGKNRGGGCHCRECGGE